MGLKKELDKLKFDSRLTAYHLTRGKLKKEELAAHLASLPDSADNVYNEEDDDLDNPGVFEDDASDGNDDVEENLTDDTQDAGDAGSDNGEQNNSGF